MTAWWNSYRYLYPYPCSSSSQHYDRILIVFWFFAGTRYRSISTNPSTDPPQYQHDRNVLQHDPPDTVLLGSISIGLLLVLVLVLLLVSWITTDYIRIISIIHGPRHPFDRLYRSVSLSCRTGSFPLSLRESVSYSCRMVSFSSFYVSFLFSFFSIPPYLSMPSVSLSCRIGSFPRSLCHLVRVRVLYLSVASYSVVPDLFLSLYVLFSVRPYLSIRLFIVSYRIHSSLFTCSCSSSSLY